MKVSVACPGHAGTLASWTAFWAHAVCHPGPQTRPRPLWPCHSLADADKRP